MKAAQAEGRVNPHRHDLLGVLLGDLFDVHSAFGRKHDGDRGRLTVHDHGQVVFLGDVAASFDIDLVHDLAFGSGLRRHQGHADHLRGDFGTLFRRLHQLHAAGLTATAGMNLSLHHRDLDAEAPHGKFGLDRRMG